MTKTILIVDDDSLIRESLGRFFERNNDIPILCSTLREADDAIKENNFDAVLIDSSISEPSDRKGYDIEDFSKEVKKRNERTIILSISGYDRKIANVDANFPKPINLDELYNFLRRIKNE